MDTLTVWDRYPLAHAARIAERTLAARTRHRARRPRRRGIAALREAVAIEDQIPYDEPPGWHAPARHTLGALLLAAGQPAEAEAVYREELRAQSRQRLVAVRTGAEPARAEPRAGRGARSSSNWRRPGSTPTSTGRVAVLKRDGDVAQRRRSTRQA